MNAAQNLKPWNGLPLLIFGTSGISKEVKNVIDEINAENPVDVYEIIGFVSECKKDVGSIISECGVVCCDEDFEDYIKEYVQLGVVIPLGTPAIKKKIVEKIAAYPNLVYPNIISPSAKIMDKHTVEMGVGNIICSGCILTTEIKIGSFNLININSTIGHNVIIGNYGVINPLASVSGGVKVADEVLLGAGCAVKQGISVGKKSIVGLGAIIVKDVDEDSVMICKAAERKK